MYILVGCAIASLVVAAPAGATFPGKNGRIAFSSDRGNEQLASSIFTMNADGSGVTRVTNPGNSRPRWSADGTEVVFTSTRHGFANPEIYRMNSDGSGQVRLTDDPAFDTTPTWSPDGTTILFNSNLGGFLTSDIYAMDREGGAVAQVTQGASREDSPDWSPDGTEIAYESDSGDSDIFVMHPDGSSRQDLMANEPFSRNDRDPSWSPDGRRIAFATTIGFTTDIYVMDADGSDVTRLTESLGAAIEPAWSPDGTRIAYATTRHDPSPTECDPCNLEIYTMAADGSDQRRITFDPAADRAPSWQPRPGPARDDFKNAAQFCRAEGEFWGEQEFRRRYGGGANAHGKCVTRKS